MGLGLWVPNGRQIRDSSKSSVGEARPVCFSPYRFLSFYAVAPFCSLEWQVHFAAANGGEFSRLALVGDTDHPDVIHLGSTRQLLCIGRCKAKLNENPKYELESHKKKKKRIFKYSESFL